MLYVDPKRRSFHHQEDNLFLFSIRSSVPFTICIMLMHDTSFS